MAESLYHPDYPRQALHLAKLGATDDELAEFFGVSVRTIYRWKHDHPDFCQALKLGKEEPDNRIVRSLYHRALGFRYIEQQAFKVKTVDYNDQGKRIFESERVEVVEVERAVPADTVACIFWLKNRDKANWRDKVEHELSGKGAFALTITEALPGEAIPPTPTTTGKHDDER